MKLISRKAVTATIAAAAISTASLTAPAMAQETTPEAGIEATTPAKEDSSSEDTSSDSDLGSSDSDLSSDFFEEDMTTGEKIKEIVTILTGIGALFGALVTINKNIERLINQFG